MKRSELKRSTNGLKRTGFKKPVNEDGSPKFSSFKKPDFKKDATVPERQAVRKPRKPLKPVSDHRRDINRQRAILMRDHFGPQHTWRCWIGERAMNEYITIPGDAGHVRIHVGRCFGEIHGHEILKRSRAGSTDENLLNMEGIRTLCNVHNDWIELHDNDARLLGLSKHYGEK